MANSNRGEKEEIYFLPGLRLRHGRGGNRRYKFYYHDIFRFNYFSPYKVVIKLVNMTMHCAVEDNRILV